MGDKLMLGYDSVNLLFPEFFKEDSGFSKYKENPGSINQRTVSFTRNGSILDVKIWPWSIPHTMSDLPHVQEQIIKPTIELVLRDIKPADGLLDKLRALAVKKKHECKFYFEREYHPESYMVYDYYLSKDQKLFEKLLRLKTKVPKDLIKTEYQSLVGLARHIGQETGKIAYVKGSTLEETLGRALEIYGLADEINKIPLAKED